MVLCFSNNENYDIPCMLQRQIGPGASCSAAAASARARTACVDDKRSFVVYNVDGWIVFGDAGRRASAQIAILKVDIIPTS